MAKKKQKNSKTPQPTLSDEQFIKQRIRSVEIGKCYITDGLTDSGEGIVIVSRRHTGGRVSFASYLVDTWCTGVKDGFYRLREWDDELDELVERAHAKECTYDEAHNWVYGALAFAEEGGIAPYKGFALTKYFLKEDTDDVPLIDYDFGRDGKHCLVAHSGLEASRYLPLLRKTLGDDGFTYIIGNDGDSSTSDDDQDDDEGPLTIDEGLSSLSKERMLQLAKSMPFELDDSLSEEDIRRQYRDMMLEHTEEVLKRLPTEDIMVLMMTGEEHNADFSTTLPQTYHDTVLETLGLATCGEFDDYDSELTIYVAKEFAEKAIPVVQTLADDKHYAMMRRTETYIEGMANLYGMVSLEQVKQYVASQMENEETTGQDINNVVMGTFTYSFALQTMVYTDEEGKKRQGEGDEYEAWLDKHIFFMSRFATSEYKNQYDMLSTPQVTAWQHKEADDTTLTLAGMSVTPMLPNSSEEQFKKALQSVGVNGKLGLICFNLWFRTMREDCDLGEDSFSASYDLRTCREYFEQEVVSKHRLSSKQRQKVYEALDDYLDHMPRWTLRGHCRAEKPSHLSA